MKTGLGIHNKLCKMTESKTPEPCGTLRSLCIKIVLHYPKLTEKGFRLLPFEVIQAILLASVHNRSICLIQQVLKFWPSPVAVLSGVPRAQCNEEFVARAVVEYISKRGEADKVQVIDIRQRNIGFLGSTALCTAVIAANRDSKVTEVASGTSFNVATHVMSVLTVYADICVNYSNPDTVLRALETKNGFVQLCIFSFSAVELGDDRLSGLLGVLNPDHLVVLDLSYNGLAYYDNVSIDLSTIFQEMTKFTKLRALSLSYNSLAESHMMNLCKVLEKLPCLVSLDLNGNFVGGSIGCLLNSINQPLKCLRLRNGRVCDSGIRNIAGSKH